jgi:hypothetical protein
MMCVGVHVVGVHVVGVHVDGVHVVGVHVDGVHVVGGCEWQLKGVTDRESTISHLFQDQRNNQALLTPDTKTLLGCYWGK